MTKAAISNRRSEKLASAGKGALRLCVLAATYYLVEGFAAMLLRPDDLMGFWFGALWSFLLAAVAMMLPRLGGRIFFGVTYFAFVGWTLAQTGYDCVFGNIMWITDSFYASEGFGFLADVLGSFPLHWWLGAVFLIAVGVLILKFFPRFPKTVDGRIRRLAGHGAVIALAVIQLFAVPQLLFLRDDGVWGTHSEYGQSTSYEAAWKVMYDAEKVYDMAGIYQLTAKDIWKNFLYPLTPAYRTELSNNVAEINAFFAARGEREDNEMTGIFEGKNVVLVLMESMDDWMITKSGTPVLYRLMNEGISFTNFWTPQYGTARTLNSEFCMNTGIYLPTTGNYVFNYVTNAFNQSFANQMNASGYSSEVFHYNSGEFYSREVFEPALGYNRYNSYMDYYPDESDKALLDEQLLFEIPDYYDLFFREGQTFNCIITRHAHLGYKFNQIASSYALSKHPGFRVRYDSEEEICARAKAKLVDEMFRRLLQELEVNGQLQNTVIIGMTDHYTYGYENTEELMALSGAANEFELERTPCFVWSADGPALTVDKTMNTSDFLPTMLNLLGVDTPYSYLGQDAFDPDYAGYVIFPDGRWIADGIYCSGTVDGEPVLYTYDEDKVIREEFVAEMSALCNEYVRISNLLLTSDYYK